MASTTRAMIFVAMIVFTIVSMCTTYISLNDSILPEPKVHIPFNEASGWDCSILALLLSVGIGVMLFALKVAIIDEQKRLNILGVIGLSVVAFISISFNLDVLYRTADREFFLRYTTSRMKSNYTDYLSEVQTNLLKTREELRIQVARQEGELEAEVEGLREKPAGYGPEARKEDYELILLKKTSAVSLESIDEALAAKGKADELLADTSPKSLDEIQQLEDQLRVAVKDVGAVTGIPLPEPVPQVHPLFAVFKRLFDFKTVGIMEVFVLLVAIILDLGDIVGYSLVPNKPQKPKFTSVTAIPTVGPEVIPSPSGKTPTPLVGYDDPEPDAEEEPPAPSAANAPSMRLSRHRTKRPFRFGRR